MVGKYDDIIDTPYPYPTHRLKMSMSDRAAQFAPFAALTGFEEVIDETAQERTLREETAWQGDLDESC